MAAVSVRNLDDQVKERLRIRAALHGRPMESEIRAILAEAVSEPVDRDGLLATLLDRRPLARRPCQGGARAAGRRRERPQRATSPCAHGRAEPAADGGRQGAARVAA